jgi:DNA-binding transcriptional regulator LsrR (DeoR family)
VARLPGRPASDQLRLVSKVAWMYHERGLRQPQIASELSLSQPRVSRLLRQAAAMGIVRTVVVTPPGAFADLEDRIRDRYGLADVVVVDTGGSADPGPALAGATADYLDRTADPDRLLGVSSHVDFLAAAVRTGPTPAGPTAGEIVATIGTVADPEAQRRAARVVARLTALTGAPPVLLPVPAVIASETARDTLWVDPSVQAATDRWPLLTDLVTGVGVPSGDTVPAAAGEINLLFFDAAGREVPSGLTRRRIGLDADTLRAVPRRIGITGTGEGPAELRLRAVRAALLGGWLTVLITDVDAAEALAAPWHGLR